MKSPNELFKLPDIKFERKLGLIIILIFFGGLFIWIFFTKIESAAIAPGKITVIGSNRVIENYDGGILEEIKIKDGQRVKKGQILLVLDKTEASVAFTINQQAFFSLLSMKARLESELNEQTQVIYPKEIISNEIYSAVKATVSLQNRIFVENNASFNRDIEIYKQEIYQIQKQMGGSEAQLRSLQTQLVFLNKELKEMRALEAERLIKQSQLFALEREAANVNGQIGQQQAQIAMYQEKVGQTQLQINALRDKRKKELLDQLHDTQEKLDEITQRYKAADARLARTIIISPIAGVVSNLKVHTVGEVIKPGEPLMDIVPTGEEMTATVRVNPLDIDVVHPGLVAKVRLTAYKQRTTPLVMGTVDDVSADALQDERTDRSYYEASIVIDAKELARLKNVSLYPGMPVEAMIITNRLSPFMYFMDPIIRSFEKAFREQ